MIQTDVQQSVFKDVEVGGDFTFEGDITQIGYQTIVQQKHEFFEPSLERYKSSNFTSPKIISRLLSVLAKQRFLVLAGSSDIDKDSLAKHTASCLIEELNSSGNEILAKEWYRSSDSQSIEVELQNTEKNTVFILTQVNPQNIGYDLARIQRAAASGDHYVVMSTDTPFAAWKQPESTRSFWHELLREDVADSEQLINNLSQEDLLSNWYHQKLDSRERLLVLGLSFFDGLFDDQFFAALEEIVERVWQRRDASLRALDYCDLENLHQFFNFTETRDQGTKITIRFPKQRRTLFKVAWHSDRRQILSALPVMVDIVRKSVVEQLENIELYGSETRCIEIRKAIAETISDIGSISENSVQAALLQLSANQSISIQSTAAYAMAQWRDSDYALDQQLFSTLYSWLDLIKSRHIIDQVDAILKGRNKENKGNSRAEDYIKVTVALTVSYASLYDSPLRMPGSEGLSNELCGLLKKLANDNSNVVRDAFLNFTLPRVLQIHLRQLSKWLHDTIQKQVSSSSSESSIIKFNKSVGISLALAYIRDPEGTVKILENWTDEGLKNIPEFIDISAITSRESLLATVARTYGEIEYVKNTNKMSPEDIFERLHTILQKERHPFVREAILFAIGRQARLHFDEIEPQFQSLVTEIKENEREDIVQTLADIYFEQRISLSGGDHWSSLKFIKIGSTFQTYRYQIWTNEQRPQTPIEEAMCDWIKNALNIVAQQIATRSLVSFANQLDKDEEEEIDRILKNLDADTSSQNLEHRNLPTKTSQDFYVQQITPWLTISFKWVQYFVFKRDFYESFVDEWSYYKQAVAGILPEALKQDSSSQYTMDFVLKRLTDIPDKKLKIIVDLLKLAIGIAKNPSRVIFGGGLLVIFFFWFFAK
jgi:hypothetical protein